MRLPSGRIRSPSANWLADHWYRPYACVIPMPNARGLAGSVSMELYVRVSANGIKSGRKRSVFCITYVPVDGSIGSAFGFFPPDVGPGAGAGPVLKLAPVNA